MLTVEKLTELKTAAVTHSLKYVQNLRLLMKCQIIIRSEKEFLNNQSSAKRFFIRTTQRSCFCQVI